MLRQLAAFIITTLTAAATTRNLTAYVDTRIGTGGGGYGVGQLNPGAQFPFGLMRVGPDTSLGLEPLRVNFELFGGYYFDDTHVECFSHTHLVGAGEGDLQNIGVMLTRSASGVEKRSGYASTFAHEGEVALPGYYAVDLVSAAARAEVTVSGTHGAIHRYTCLPTTDGAPCVLVVDVCHGFEMKLGVLGSSCKEAQIVSAMPLGLGRLNVTARVLDSGSFTSDQPVIRGMWVYWAAIVEVTTGGGAPMPLNVSSWVNHTQLDKVTFNPTRSGSLGVVIVAPAPPSDGSLRIIVRAGLSVVSTASAVYNLVAEQRGSPGGPWLTFDRCVDRAVEAWETQLALVRVRGGAANNRGNLTTFLTALYHVLLSPTIYDGADGRYINIDLREASVAPGSHFMSDLSIWDVYRTQMPLLLWLRPDMAVDTAGSMLIIANQTGYLPKWVLGNVETDTMVGYHSAVVLLDWWTKGLRGLDASVPSLVAHKIEKHTRERLGPLGYIPLEKDERGSSITLDEAIDCGAIVRCAELGLCPPPSAWLRECATAYRRVFDPSQQLVLPRFENGSFMPLDPYLPYPLERHYTEGNAAQYRWYVPHNLTDLIGLFPSVDAAADALDELFETSLSWPLGNVLPNWGYWAGNEIDILAPYVFSYMGNAHAHLSQRWVTSLLSTFYPPTPGGIPGNDDYGAMSAWVVFSYVGLYPVASTSDYVLVTPQFDEVVVSFDPQGRSATPWRHLKGNDTAILIVTAHHRPPLGTPAYVANASLNGRWIGSPIISHAALVGTGTTAARLDVYLSAKPTVFGSRGDGGRQPVKSEKRGTRPRHDV